MNTGTLHTIDLSTLRGPPWLAPMLTDAPPPSSGDDADRSCDCGATFTSEAWLALDLVARTADGLEVRLCIRCLATITGPAASASAGEEG